MGLIWLVEVSSRGDRHRRIKMNQSTPPRCIILRQQHLNRYVYELRVADIAVAICNCKSHHFADQVKIFGCVMAQGFELIALEKIQLFQYGDSATRRRLRIEGVAMVSRGNRVKHKG